MKKSKNIKKAIGPLLAIGIFLIILILGFLLGKYLSYEYNKKHNTNKSIFEIFQIIKTDVPINYVLKDGAKTIYELCGKDTGICDQTVGTITLDNTDVELYIYADFDNPDETPTTYFKIGEKKISSFVYLDTFEILGGMYLVVSEPNSSNDNYIIHIYNFKGNELMNYDATNNNSDYVIIDDNLYFYFCNIEDTIIEEEETLYRFERYKVSTENVLKKTLDSSEYKKCA